MREVAHLATNRCYYAPILGIQYAQLAYTPIPEVSPIKKQELMQKEADALTKLASAMRTEVQNKNFPLALYKPWSNLTRGVKVHASDPVAIVTSAESAAAGESLNDYAKKHCDATLTPSPPAAS